jgi:hypothetical protein
MKDPQRDGRFAGRWLRRYLEELEQVTSGDALLVSTAPAALRGSQLEPAARWLREVARSR